MNLTDKVLSTCKPKFQKKATNFADKTNHKNSFFARVLCLGFCVSNRYFCQRQDWISSKITLCGKFTRWREVKQFSCEVFFFTTHLRRNLASFGHHCVPMHTNLLNILCFSCQGKVEISSIKVYAYFRGKYSPSTDFLEFNSLHTQPFHAWLIPECIT